MGSLAIFKVPVRTDLLGWTWLSSDKGTAPRVRYRTLVMIGWVLFDTNLHTLLVHGSSLQYTTVPTEPVCYRTFEKHRR
jgi:hypothetical protein